MTTIEASGINQKSAPSPIQLRSWQQDWAPNLEGLTPWVGYPTGSKTSFRCRTTTNENKTNDVVVDDLKAWVDADPGHRTFSVFAS